MPTLQGLGLTVAYGTRAVFSGLDFAVPPGRFTALIGPNGCGKSTLLRVLAGVQKPLAGRLIGEGKVALIAPAGDPPGDLTPVDLVGYGLAIRRPFWMWSAPPSEEGRVRESLALCDLSDRADDPVACLSAGEVQRAWIAAALATAPDVLLIDEPTTHLDVRFQVEILQTLVRLAATGVSVVIAIHDLTLAARFSHAVALLAGGKLAFGAPEEILEPSALSNAFGIAVSTHRHPQDGYLITLPM